MVARSKVRSTTLGARQIIEHKMRLEEPVDHDPLETLENEIAAVRRGDEILLRMDNRKGLWVLDSDWHHSNNPFVTTFKRSNHIGRSSKN